jgi:hypothetical protein
MYLAKLQYWNPTAWVNFVPWKLLLNSLHSKWKREKHNNCCMFQLFQILPGCAWNSSVDEWWGGITLTYTVVTTAHHLTGLTQANTPGDGTFEIVTSESRRLQISLLISPSLMKRDFKSTSTSKRPDSSMWTISPDSSNGRSRLN